MYTNETTNYDLPQYVEGDNFDAISDLNPAFETIDRVMKENAVNATSAINLVKETAENAQQAAIDAQRALNNAQAAAISAKAAQDAAESVTAPLEQVTGRVSELEQNSVSDENRITALEKSVSDLEQEDDIIRSEMAQDVQNLQTNINAAVNTANAANTMAETANTSAAVAQSTANNALNIAQGESDKKGFTLLAQSGSVIFQNTNETAFAIDKALPESTNVLLILELYGMNGGVYMINDIRSFGSLGGVVMAYGYDMGGQGYTIQMKQIDATHYAISNSGFAVTDAGRIRFYGR